MNRALFGALLTLVGLVFRPAIAPSQEPNVQPRDDGERGPRRVMQFVMSRRARLGLKVNLRARSTDSVGAYVDAVTPNGPAATAGIQSGDIITKVDGQSVLSGSPQQTADTRQSQPGLRLIELAARLEPNDTVPIELRRGKDRKTVSVVTADEPDIMFQGHPGQRAFGYRYLGPDGPGRMRMSLQDGDFEGQFGGMGAFLYGGPLADLELAPLNPDLGEYFGAKTGVLVVSVPKDSKLGLKGGDVILAVDGRKPASPSHLLRILRSYERGESFKIDILRKQKRETVAGRLAERGD
ncbi:MAG TPA: PDZ domain-containing protein [Gemmatimonadales bacterium]|nr:PDZ domain-containing protein [Gemmatimonadales bacterium]